MKLSTNLRSKGRFRTIQDKARKVFLRPKQIPGELHGATEPTIARSHLMSLPLELIEDICTRLPHEDQVHLYRVCRALHIIVEPLLLETLYLTVDIGRVPEELDNSLTRIASGDSPTCTYTKNLVLRAWYHPIDISARADEHTFPLLVQALRALRYIHSVKWILPPRMFSGSIGDPIIAEVLSTTPTLHTLTLDVQYMPTAAIPIIHFHGLRHIDIFIDNHYAHSPAFVESLTACIRNSPTLESLAIRIPQSWGASRYATLPTFGDLLADYPPESSLMQLKTLLLVGFRPTLDARTLPHLQLLERLTIDCVAPPAFVPEESLEHLHEYCVKLNGLISNRFDEGSLRYLVSYTGLTKLVLSGLREDPSDPHLRMLFFENVLPTHAGTLQELSLQACDIAWSYNTSHRIAIAQCSNLTKLGLSMADTRWRRNVVYAGPLTLGVVTPFRVLHDADMVADIFNAAASLQRLESLTLFPMFAWYSGNIGALFMTTELIHPSTVVKDLDYRIENFRRARSSPLPFAISVGTMYTNLQWDD